MYIVYMHTSPNGKRYIGITSKSLKERWRGLYSNNKRFHADIIEFGWENFKHEILFQRITKEEAETKEKELIALYDTTNPEKGYNIALGGPSNSGYHHSEATKNRIRGSLTGVKHTPERIANQVIITRKRWENPEYRRRMVAAHIGKNMGKDNATSKRVRQLTLDGQLIREFDALTDAERTLGINHRMISDCCKGKQKTCKGFRWEYA